VRDYNEFVAARARDDSRPHHDAILLAVSQGLEFLPQPDRSQPVQAGTREAIVTAFDVAAALDAKANGKGWTACCPAHDDTTPSLSIGENEEAAS